MGGSVNWGSILEDHLNAATVNRSLESIAQGSHADRGRVREQLRTNTKESHLHGNKGKHAEEQAERSGKGVLCHKMKNSHYLSVLGNVWKGY